MFKSARAINSKPNQTKLNIESKPNLHEPNSTTAATAKHTPIQLAQANIQLSNHELQQQVAIDPVVRVASRQQRKQNTNPAQQRQQRGLELRHQQDPTRHSIEQRDSKRRAANSQQASVQQRHIAIGSAELLALGQKHQVKV